MYPWALVFLLGGLQQALTKDYKLGIYLEGKVSDEYER